jgi:hypothetical protein
MTSVVGWTANRPAIRVYLAACYTFRRQALLVQVFVGGSPRCFKPVSPFSLTSDPASNQPLAAFPPKRTRKKTGLKLIKIAVVDVVRSDYLKLGRSLAKITPVSVRSRLVEAQ